MISCVTTGGIYRNNQNKFIEAAKNGKIDILKELLTEVDINKDIGKGTALMVAAFNAHYEVVVFLVKKWSRLISNTFCEWLECVRVR